MDTETMIRNLKKVEDDHKGDKVFTGQLNIADMAHDVRLRLEELKPYEDTSLTPEQIMGLKERVNDGWIPVEERLPKAGEHVLVSFRSAGFLPATAIISENGRWSMLQGAKGFNDVTDDVIAWRPLPEPYRPKKESEGSRRLREREEFFKE